MVEMAVVYHIDNIKLYLINYGIPHNHYLSRIGSYLIEFKINLEIFNNMEAPLSSYISKVTYGQLLIFRFVLGEYILHIDSDNIVD